MTDIEDLKSRVTRAEFKLHDIERDLENHKEVHKKDFEGLLSEVKTLFDTVKQHMDDENRKWNYILGYGGLIVGLVASGHPAVLSLIGG